jgi:mannose-6-phosphate isomerase-like protein (cupin superfamily)
MKYRCDFETVQWTSPMDGVRHKVFPFQGRRLRLVEYSSEFEPHWCERGHIGQILDGRFQIEFKDCTEIFNSGDGIAIPDGPEHRHRATVLSGIVRALFVEDV